MTSSSDISDLSPEAQDDAPGAGDDASPTVDDPNQVSFLGDEPESAATPPSGSGGGGADYRVLARKYRPQTFDDLLGQDALVRMLTNAFASGRIAHAFLLTGVRGVGKTTTARIIAKGLNCTGPGSDAGPTVNPCGVCENCVAITQDRHVDVFEMDAASRTGVDDIREILDGVRFRPVAARYKIYIIDEVHMLSRHAFNALLKTLEEPPESVKFIFATTDVGKLPVTVLSRCQRFDLRRVDSEVLVKHLADIAGREGARVSDEGLALLARAADGSVRDGLSLLDQAIALAAEQGGPDRADTGAEAGAEVGAEQLRDMLGLADATQIYDLFEQLMGGRIADALATFKTMHDSGADPLGVVQALMGVVHWLTRLKVAGAGIDMTTATEVERTRGAAMAERLAMPVLSRAWQLLMKGIGEIQNAPAAYAAAEMVLIRLAYAADLPPPADLVRRLHDDGDAAADSAATAGTMGVVGTTAAGSTTAAAAAQTSAPTGPDGHGYTAARAVAGGVGATPQAQRRAAPLADEEPLPAADAAESEPLSAPVSAPTSAAPPPDEPGSFAELVELFGTRREVALRGQLYHNVHLVAYEPGRLEIRLAEQAPRDLPNQLVKRLRDWFGAHWNVAVSGGAGDPTLADQARVAAVAEHAAAAQDPLVKAVLDTFPGARIARVTPYDPPFDAPDAAAETGNGFADEDDAAD